MTKSAKQKSVESPTARRVSDQRERAPQPAPQAQLPGRPVPPLPGRPVPPLPGRPVPPLPVQQAPPVEGEDFYWEGPYMVFTEAWHLKRGYCCGSACRHCPYTVFTKEKSL